MKTFIYQNLHTTAGLRSSGLAGAENSLGGNILVGLERKDDEKNDAGSSIGRFARLIVLSTKCNE